MTAPDKGLAACVALRGATQVAELVVKAIDHKLHYLASHCEHIHGTTMFAAFYHRLMRQAS